MTTIVLTIQDPETSSSWKIDLADDFETVLGRVFPLQAPASNLEHRANMVHNRLDGGRVSIQPQLIAAIIEGGLE